MLRHPIQTILEGMPGEAERTFTAVKAQGTERTEYTFNEEPVERPLGHGKRFSPANLIAATIVIGIGLLIGGTRC
jgi:hypothetical protein